MRIAGITIPDEKHLSISLKSVYGIGATRAKVVLEKVGVDGTKKAKDLTSDEEQKLRTLVEAFTIEGDLRREVAGNVKRLKDIQSYRGDRHAKRLPVRGQRTKTNARTLKGVKKTMGSGKRKLEKT